MSITGNAMVAAIRKRWFVAFCAPLLGAAASAGAGQSDADMAIHVRQVERSVAAQAQACESHFGDKGRTFRFVNFFWEGDHLEVLRGAALVLAGLPPTKVAASEQALRAQDQKLAEVGSKRSESDWNSACGDLFTRLVTNKGSDAMFDTATTARMSDVYARSGAKPFARRDSDYTIGCMKTQYNHGLRDFDTVKKVCSCMTDVLTSSATNEQLEAMSADPSSVASQPWLAKAQPKIAACKTLWGANPH